MKVLWKCCGCKSRGRTEVGEVIYCEGEGCATSSFEILDVLEINDGGKE